MTIQEIANILNNCAQANCEKCPYNECLSQYGVKACQNRLITKMGEACRAVAETLEDDLS